MFSYKTNHLNLQQTTYLITITITENYNLRNSLIAGLWRHSQFLRGSVKTLKKQTALSKVRSDFEMNLWLMFHKPFFVLCYIYCPLYFSLTLEIKIIYFTLYVETIKCVPIPLYSGKGLRLITSKVYWVFGKNWWQADFLGADTPFTPFILTLFLFKRVL